MANPLSLHLPDRDNFTDDELAAIRDLNPTSLLVLAFSADKGAAEQTNALVAELGITDLLVRCYADNVQELKPKKWADICSERLARYRAPRLHLIPGNEMNLDQEGFNGDLGALVLWLSAVGKELHAPDYFKLHLPAPWAGWVGQNEAEAKRYWDAVKAAGAHVSYDCFDAHAYGDGFDIWKYCSQKFGQQPWITEFNQVAMSTAADALNDNQPRRAAACFYFTLRWECYSDCVDGWRQDDRFSLMRYPELYADFKAQETAVAAPPPIILDPQEDTVMTDDEAIVECRKYLWLAVNPGLEFNQEPALYKYWTAHIDEMGSPVTPEFPGADNKYQGFANGIWRWLNDGANTVEKVA